ncbi:rhomboid family intramembrane serine protease [Neptunitalea lumnitzerae]|uniref:Peptidase S54 rhomboid domain-containing protein n=1 Tax=Neptunitalea lumnitzerae TaxID=2965509 RepID=A0ABQ5MEL6_9FLAO|nr:rhomboid family intramembrane serine protease [Neptunitalea sp. Y10]GLB47818.1 hypothetical protein Y10_01860 [Neptunitalea sp. Y10]
MTNHQQKITFRYLFKTLLSNLNPSTAGIGIISLFILNTLVFSAMVWNGAHIIFTTNHTLLTFGGMRYQEVTNGQYWRMASAMFVHNGILHYCYNMGGLLLAGNLLQKVLPTYKILILYLVTGIIAAFFTLYFNSYSVSVGASGAIFGLYGYIIAYKLETSNLTAWWLILLFPIASLLIGFTLPGVDNAAHFGGLIAGFTIGVIGHKKT